MSNRFRRKKKHPLRRKKFVDARVQGALAWRLFCHWIAFMGIAGVAALILNFCSNPMRPLSEHFDNLWWSHGPLLISLVFLLPVFIFDSIQLSHRFAGPVVRLRNAMRNIAAGDAPQHLKFRDKDFWQELAGDYNGMLDALIPNLGDVPTGVADEQGETEEEPVAAATP